MQQREQKGCWVRKLEIDEGKTMWNLEEQAQISDFVLRVNMMLLKF